MMGRNSLFGIASLMAASLAVPSGAAIAMDAHADETVEADKGERLEFEIAGTTVSAQMPCAEPQEGPMQLGQQTAICIVEDMMFILAASEGLDPESAGPMGSDFDAAYEEIEGSEDTASIEELEVDGRRTMRADRGPDPKFGTMQAVQVAPDALVFVITLSRPGLTEVLSDAEKQQMRDFVMSLEVSP